MYASQSFGSRRMGQVLGFRVKGIGSEDLSAMIWAASNSNKNRRIHQTVVQSGLNPLNPKSPVEIPK